MWMGLDFSEDPRPKNESFFILHFYQGGVRNTSKGIQICQTQNYNLIRGKYSSLNRSQADNSTEVRPDFSMIKTKKD